MLGRPSTYTPEIAATICERIAAGQSVRELARAEGMPHRVTILRWLAAHEEFRSQYAIAKEAQLDGIADEILDIADDGSNDWIERLGKDGECIGYAVNGEAVARSRLRVDSRKWLLSKLVPKKYGDSMKLEHGGKIEHAAQITVIELPDNGRGDRNQGPAGAAASVPLKPG